MILFVLVLVAAPFVLPVLFYVALRRLRHRVDHLEVIVEDQRISIDALKRRVREQREPVVETKREPIVKTTLEPIVEVKQEIPPPVVTLPPAVGPVAAHSEPIEPPVATPPPPPRPHRPPAAPRLPMPPVPPHAAPVEKAFDWENVIGVSASPKGEHYVVRVLFRPAAAHSWPLATSPDPPAAACWMPRSPARSSPAPVRHSSS
jgi:hypothetical protein